LTEKYELRAESIARARITHQFLSLAAASEFLSPSLLKPKTAERALIALRKMQALAKEILKKKATIDASYDEDFYKLDARSVHKRLTINCGNFFSRLFGGEYRRLIGEIRLCKRDGKKPNYGFAVESVNDLRVYQQKTAEFEALEKEIAPWLGRAYDGVNTAFEQCISDVERLTALQASGASFGGLAKLEKEAYYAQKLTFEELAARYEKVFAESAEAEDRLAARFDKTKYDLLNATLKSLTKKCEGCYEKADELDNWCAFVGLLENLKEAEKTKKIFSLNMRRKQN
jgi:hypothetical protein